VLRVRGAMELPSLCRFLFLERFPCQYAGFSKFAVLVQEEDFSCRSYRY
jgi:hypothetical protein